MEAWQEEMVQAVKAPPSQEEMRQAVKSPWRWLFRRDGGRSPHMSVWQTPVDGWQVIAVLLLIGILSAPKVALVTAYLAVKVALWGLPIVCILWLVSLLVRAVVALERVAKK